MCKLRKLPFFLAFIIMTLNGLAFADGRATLIVSATVVANIKQTVIHQVGKINITETDLTRGFVEIPSGTILQVKTNHQKGYFLSFEGGSELFREAWVTDKRRTTVLSSNGGIVHQPYANGNLEIKELSYRFYLSENIQPGLYPWPFRVKASLL